MSSQKTADVIAHYTARHDFRGDTFGSQPFANYGYWAKPGLSIEQASEALTDLIAQTAGMKAGDRVLDVGCGYGANAVVYMRHFGPAQITGIDVTEVRIISGRDYVKQHGFSAQVALQLGDATKMEFADGSFDRVVSVECAFHFDTRRDFLREAFRVLAPGGTLALSDMIPKRGVDPKSYMTGHRAQISGVCLDMPVNAYDADTYAGNLRDAGFTDVRVESIVDQARLPFAQALDEVGVKTGGERGGTIRQMAKRIRDYVEAGEDYVLVYARKP